MTHPVPDPVLPAAVAIDGLAESNHVALDGVATNHVDYDLHPLCVRSFEHYVEREGDERFHIR